MNGQIVCFIIAIVLFVIDGILVFRSWAHHGALIAFGLAFFVLGFIVPLM